jgi:peptidoglycan hydrolase-like protein with peptidoglycan-binding domain
MLRTVVAALGIGLAVTAAGAVQTSSRTQPPVTAASVNDAAPKSATDSDPSLIVKAEVLLDRARISSGAIDGLDGDNFRSAIRAFQEDRGLAVSGKLDAETWSALANDGSPPVLKTYAISEADVASPVTKVIPAELEEMARLPGLSYTSPTAEIAEKFHMSQSLLSRLNPRADFDRAGSTG